VLSAVSVLVCAQHESQINPRKRDNPVSPSPPATQNLASVSKSDSLHDAFRQRAEAAAGKAVDLRKKQTEENLKAAISWFGEIFIAKLPERTCRPARSTSA
jgi:hypothetical protein